MKRLVLILCIMSVLAVQTRAGITSGRYEPSARELQAQGTGECQGVPEHNGGD